MRENPDPAGGVRLWVTGAEFAASLAEEQDTGVILPLPDFVYADRFEAVAAAAARDGWALRADAAPCSVALGAFRVGPVPPPDVFAVALPLHPRAFALARAALEDGHAVTEEELRATCGDAESACAAAATRGDWRASRG